MSKFYATIEGNRQPKTCGGSANSGIRASAQSWTGSVIINMDYRANEDNTEDLYVRVGTNDGSSSYVGWSSPEFRGTFAEFKQLLQLNEDIKSGKVSIVKHRIKK